MVQTDIAERLMNLAVNADATPEVQAIALAGVRDVQNTVQSASGKDPVFQRIGQEIKLFLANPQQNAPKPRSAGAPAGPPV